MSTPHELVGKTIAAVSTKDITLRDTYDDEYEVTQTTLTFTDGTEITYGDIEMDLYEV